MAALADYALQRDQLLPSPKTTSLFVSITGKRLDYGDVQCLFQILVSGAGVGASSPVRPRIHDLRHSFAVRSLVDWYGNGENVQTRLAWLATYLGHRKPRFTYWYLSASPELLALAASRVVRGGPAMGWLAPTLQSFFTDRMVRQRQASPRTSGRLP